MLSDLADEDDPPGWQGYHSEPVAIATFSTCGRYPGSELAASGAGPVMPVTRAYRLKKRVRWPAGFGSRRRPIGERYPLL